MYSGYSTKNLISFFTTVILGVPLPGIPMFCLPNSDMNSASLLSSREISFLGASSSIVDRSGFSILS